MKVLVTGATGFVGRYVVGELLSRGCDVIASSTNMVKAQLHGWFDKVEYIRCDLNVGQNDFFEFFGRPEELIHLAWQGLPHYKE